MLTKHITGVEHAFDVIEGDDLGCDGLTHAVKRQSHVTLVELGVWPNGAFNDSLVVSEHEASGTDVMERLCMLTSTDKVVVPTGTGEVLTSTEGVLTSTGGALTSAEGSTSTSVLVAVFGSMVMNHHGEISAISIVKTEC